ncbi:alpha/beta fold hydrolase [Tomitella gaofuii]|uniref:alpha/beta fold hydrolase n=1 Tax=Tomitella gaofuii TaxID=2760083 RepID=UPI0015F884F3|nr:alpha/beta hydrolase [Tomitella gaofuii]
MDPVTSAPQWFTDALAARPSHGEVTVGGAQVRYRVWERHAAPRHAAPRDAGPQDAATPGILLVHGGAAHSHWWDHIAPQLADRHRVAALDLTGHGDSETRDHYALAQWADELVAVAEAAGLGARPVVVGHSMGGMVTYVAAHRHGDRLGGIQVIDSPIRLRTPAEEETRGSALRRPKKVYPDVDTALAHFRLIPAQTVTLPYVIDHVARTSMGPVPGGWSWKFDPSMTGRDGSDLLGAGPPPCPMAYFRAQDGIIADDVFAEMRARFGPGALVFELPHTGHHPMADQPLLLVAAVRSVLAAWAADGRLR